MRVSISCLSRAALCVCDCSVLLPQVFGITGQGCQLSVCRVSCLSVSAIPWTNATITRTSTFRHRRPFTSSQGVSTAEGIIHKQIGSRMPPNNAARGVQGEATMALCALSGDALNVIFEALCNVWRIFPG